MKEKELIFDVIWIMLVWVASGLIYGCAQEKVFEVQLIENGHGQYNSITAEFELKNCKEWE